MTFEEYQELHPEFILKINEHYSIKQFEESKEHKNIEFKFIGSNVEINFIELFFDDIEYLYVWNTCLDSGCITIKEYYKLRN